MINKFVSIIGWFTIAFIILGIFNLGVFKLSYVWPQVTEVKFSTDQLNVVKKAKEIINNK